MDGVYAAGANAGVAEPHDRRLCLILIVAGEVDLNAMARMEPACVGDERY
jgi:hypothetical protein